MVEGGILANRRLHAAHTWRELRIFDVQFDIGGKLTHMAVRAQIVRTRHLRLPYSGEHWFGTQLPVVSLVAARTCNAQLVSGRDRKLQQLRQSLCPGLVHGRAHRHFKRFQIHTAGLAPSLEQDAQQ